jgi:hypothetical protein
MAQSEHCFASRGLVEADMQDRYPGKGSIDIELNIEVLPTPDFSSFTIARQQVSDDLDKVVEKALRKRLPKLVDTRADRRILMLEREHMNLLPEQIIRQIEKLRPSFPSSGMSTRSGSPKRCFTRATA